MSDSRRHRGPHPNDAELFSEQALPSLMAAVSDLSWLRTRGYSDGSSVKLVGDRYRLRGRQRTAARRCACSDSALGNRALRQCAPKMVNARHLLVDGLNVITTIEVALARGVLLLGRDSCLRDMASFHGSYRLVHETARAVEILVDVIDSLQPSEATIYIDRPVSNSGRLAEIVRTTASDKGSCIQATTADRVDELLKASNAVVASADSAILDECGDWLNLARMSVERHHSELEPLWLLDLS
ncbi:MAG: DUF434 domain-containing protein [Myxococcales bacterium]|nr:DUF434 domain-containing protein [Deltaproteobacteria bacterium]NNE17306.1 DUF434 domain-containing protein [Myxococcales bacterium]